MKGFRTIYDRFIAPTCILNLLIDGFFMLVQFTAGSVNYDRPGMTPSGFLTCLIFSALVVCAGQVFLSPTLPLVGKVAIHCSLSTLFFLVLFVFMGSYYADRMLTALLMAFIFIFIYFIVATPILIFFAKRRKQKNDTKAYTSMLYKSAK